MEIISKMLFWVANSLLIPDIILLLVLLVRALVLAGSFYGQYMSRRKIERQLKEKIKKLRPEKLHDLRESAATANNSLFIQYLCDMLNSPASAAYSDYLMSNFEVAADKDLSVSKTLTKLGPILGLVGTLIAMSPALVGLSKGDITGMAYNMQVVFATTVVGLVVSAIGFLTLQVKQRWYAQEVNSLDYVSKIILERPPQS